MWGQPSQIASYTHTGLRCPSHIELCSPSALRAPSERTPMKVKTRLLIKCPLMRNYATYTRARFAQPGNKYPKALTMNKITIPGKRPWLVCLLPVFVYMGFFLIKSQLYDAMTPTGQRRQESPDACCSSARFAANRNPIATSWNAETTVPASAHPVCRRFNEMPRLQQPVPLHTGWCDTSHLIDSAEVTSTLITRMRFSRSTRLQSLPG